MTGTTRRLAEFAAGIDFASLDPEVVERTRMLLWTRSASPFADATTRG